ncbi:MAG: hypothetical protein VW014_04530, partial [Halieaceae bacterium]
ASKSKRVCVTCQRCLAIFRINERAKLSRLLEKAPSRGSSMTDEAGLSHKLVFCVEGSSVT